MKTSNQTKLERQSGRKIKQGDTSSVFRYILSTHDEKALSGFSGGDFLRENL